MEITTKNAFEVVVLVLGALLAVAAIGGVAFVGSAILIASVARAEGADYRDNRWVRQSIRQQYRVCDVWGNCEYRYRRVYRPTQAYRDPEPIRYYAAPRDDERWERDERERCLERKRVVGTEHATTDGALSAAKRQWMSLVRWDHGEKFMNIDIAKNYQQRCERSSTNETTLGRAAEGLAGSFYTRCEVVAEPCVARRIRPEDERRQ